MKNLCAILFILGMAAQFVSGQKLPSSARLSKVKFERKEKIKRAVKTAGLSWGSSVFIRIFKTEKQLELWIKDGSKYRLYKTYPICTFGSGGLGPKLKEGDGKAPEGFYYVKPKQMNPYSTFHLSFNLGYPNAYDRAHGRTGSALMVHGSCVSIGCYAVTDPRIEEIYLITEAALRHEQAFFRVHIFPFRLKPLALKLVKNAQWYEFWQNLKTGYDYFEKHKLPPNVRVRNKMYVFD